MEGVERSPTVAGSVLASGAVPPKIRKPASHACGQDPPPPPLRSDPATAGPSPNGPRCSFLHRWSHEPAPPEGAHVVPCQSEPLAVRMSGCEALVPVRLDAARIVGRND